MRDAQSAVGYLVHGSYLTILLNNMRTGLALLQKQPTVHNLYAADASAGAR